MIPILFRIGQKSELSSDPPGGRLKLPSPTLSKKKEKEKKNKKYKKDQKRPQARLLQERCVHCHELFSQVLHWLSAGQWAVGRAIIELLSVRVRLGPARVSTPRTWWSKVSSACLVWPVPSVFSTTVITRMKTLQVSPSLVSPGGAGGCLMFQMMTFVPVITLTATWVSGG